MSLNLRPCANQVAGHRFDEGRHGSLVDDDGKFYKPLQSGTRGDNETEFYEKIWADANVSEEVKQFFPKYFGVVDVPLELGGDVVKKMNSFAVMEDLTTGYRNPCILDVKLGRQTWYYGAPQKYIEKCRVKDISTTSSELGFRIGGMQIYSPKTGETWKADRTWCKRITVNDMRAAIDRFFLISEYEMDSIKNEGTARQILNTGNGLIPQLRKLRSWFALQTKYHFFSSSILIIYEGDDKFADWENSENRNVSVHMVDFAHVIDGNGKVDENVLFGLDNFVDHVKKTL